MTSQAWGIKATITALEAPIFGEPNDKSKVIQYVRKGTQIFIHDAEAFEDPYKEMNFAKDPREFEIINKDLFITDEVIYKPKKESKFYKTLAKSGREAYILKEHVWIDYKDRRELTQKITRPDNTDYRIEEPLTKDYPLIKEKTGYRGQTTMALGQPNYRAYPYRQDILDTSFNLVKEFQFVYSNLVKDNFDRRLYFGYAASLHFSQQEYLLSSQQATQENARFGLGPYLSYDIYRGSKFYISAFTSILFVIYDTMEIKIKDNNTDENETRTYQSLLSLQPSVGSNINFIKIFGDMDAVLGFNIKGLLPKTYNAQTSGEYSDFWVQTNAADTFEQPFRVELSYFFGVQSTY